MSTLCSCSPMRKTLQCRLSSRSSSAEYSCTDSTPFWSSSVLFGLGRSSERRTSGQSSRPGHELRYHLTRSLAGFYRFPLMRFNRLATKAHLLPFIWISCILLEQTPAITRRHLETSACRAFAVDSRRHIKRMIIGLQHAEMEEIKTATMNQSCCFQLGLAPVFCLFPKHQKH